MAEHSLWVEKYRPKDLSTSIGNEHLKEKVKRYLNEENSSNSGYIYKRE